MTKKRQVYFVTWEPSPRSAVQETPARCLCDKKTTGLTCHILPLAEMSSYRGRIEDGSLADTPLPPPVAGPHSSCNATRHARPATLWLQDLIARFAHNIRKNLLIDWGLRSNRGDTAPKVNRGPSPLDGIQSIDNVLRTAFAAHTANEEIRLIWIVGDIGIGHDSLLNTRALLPIRAAALARKTGNNARET